MHKVVNATLLSISSNLISAILNFSQKFKDELMDQKSKQTFIVFPWFLSTDLYFLKACIRHRSSNIKPDEHSRTGK